MRLKPQSTESQFNNEKGPSNSHEIWLYKLQDQSNDRCFISSITCSTPDELALLYDSELSSLLDSMVPVVSVTCSRRPSDPWFDQECRLKKRAVRRLFLSNSGVCVGVVEGVSYLPQFASKQARVLLDAEDQRQKVFSTPTVAFNRCTLGPWWYPIRDNIDAQQFHDYFDAKISGV